MANFKLKAIIEAQDRLSPALRRLNTRLAPMRASFSRIGASARSLGSTISSIARPLALFGVAGAAGLAAMTKSFIDSTSELHDFLQQVQFAPAAFQQLEYAFGQSGVAGDEFRTAIEKLSKNVGDFKTGSGTLASFLKKSASPAFREQLKHVKGNAEAFDLIIGALLKETDVQKRAALVQAAFGKSSQKMLALLSEGAPAVGKLRKEFERLHGPLGQRTIDAAEGTGDALGRLKASLTGVRDAVLGRLLPAFTPLLDRLSDYIAANRDILALKVEKAFIALADWAKDPKTKQGFLDLVDGIKSIARFARAAVASVGGIKDALLILVGIRLLPLVTAVYGLAAAFAAALVPAGGLAAVMAASGITLAIFGIAAIVIVLAKHWDEVTEAVKRFIELLRRTNWSLLIPGLGSLKLVLGAVDRFRTHAALPTRALERAGGPASPFLKGPLALGRPSAPRLRYGPPLASPLAQGGAGRQTVGGRIDIHVEGPRGTRVKAKPDPGTKLNTYMGLNLRGEGAGL